MATSDRHHQSTPTVSVVFSHWLGICCGLVVFGGAASERRRNFARGHANLLRAARPLTACLASLCSHMALCCSNVDADGSADDDDVFGDFAEDLAAEAVNSDLEAPWGGDGQL